MQTAVLHIIPSFHQGGSEQQAVQLVKLLKEDGTFRIHAACLDKSGILLSEIEDAGFTEIPEFPLKSFYDANMLGQLRRCRNYIRDMEIEIVQTHDFYTNIFGMAAASAAGVPVRIAAKRETGMRSPTQKFVERRAFGLAHAIVANAEGVKRYLIESGISETKISVIHNGIDLEKMKPTEQSRGDILKEFGLPTGEERQFVTIVANLRNKVKNHRMFLRAAARVRDDIPNVGFLIAGEGELVEETREFAAEVGIAEQTFFLGRCSQIAGLLNISDVCVLTSDSEGFSNSILEYMAAGKPVVVTDVGGTAEAVTESETGFLVTPNDHEAMASKLVQLLSERDKARSMGRAGKKNAEEKFSLSARKNKTLALYRSQMERAGRT